MHSNTPLLWNEYLCTELLSAECKISVTFFKSIKLDQFLVCVSVLYQWNPTLSVGFFSASWSLLSPFLSSSSPVELLTWCLLFPTSCQEASPNSSLQKWFKGQGIRDTAEVRLWQSQQRIPHLYAAQKDIPGTAHAFVLCQKTIMPRMAWLHYCNRKGIITVSWSKLLAMIVAYEHK